MGESEVRQRKEEKSEEASKTEEKSSVCETSGNFQTYSLQSLNVITLVVHRIFEDVSWKKYSNLKF